ncbi:MAG: alcohol dehydrogenase catalytic domain-containing protein [Anaerolineae bacterium]|nr:alcohol dehydrogenase catalytic domain-containing protein [Anaerolineae bacterium]
MRALIYDGQTLQVRDDYPRPAPPPGEALVRVRLAGICNTDLEIVRGYMGFRGVLGHEFVGVVEECAARSEAVRSEARNEVECRLIGQRVVGEINAYCGECPTCRAGRPTHCPNRTTLGIWGRDGAFAEYLTLPIRNLHVVPDDVPDEVAVFTEPLAAALEILEGVHLRPTDRVVVLGDGKLGLLVAQVLALVGCDLIAVGRHREKLAILARRGIPTALESEAEGLSADVVVECTGKPEGFASAKRILRPRGTLVLKSTYHGQVEADLTALVVDEITLVGSRCGPFPPALRLLARGLVDVGALVQEVYPLSRGLEAFARAAQPGVLKVLLRVE